LLKRDGTISLIEKEPKSEAKFTSQLTCNKNNNNNNYNNTSSSNANNNHASSIKKEIKPAVDSNKEKKKFEALKNEYKIPKIPSLANGSHVKLEVPVNGDESGQMDTNERLHGCKRSFKDTLNDDKHKDNKHVKNSIKIEPGLSKILGLDTDQDKRVDSTVKREFKIPKIPTLPNANSSQSEANSRIGVEKKISKSSIISNNEQLKEASQVAAANSHIIGGNVKKEIKAEPDDFYPSQGKKRSENKNNN
jgi:hypothetical protein